MEYYDYWARIYDSNKQSTTLIHSYWSEYSHFGTWQFWVVVCLMILPLFILIFLVDRQRIFEVFFFGFTVHVLWTYIDIALANHNKLVHPYFLSPQLPYALSITTSAIPVAFLLVYQYCTNKGKSFFVYIVVISALLAFGFGTIEKLTGFLVLNNGMNQLYLFFIDIVVATVAYFFTHMIKNFANWGNH
ncbi:hypothetical protein BC6307_07290 [Sutcliffiella cohnii]|uniref:Uncharacterized protein n=1 Tax=Sutcliffiella cohnii TaxID=33932 RepID=A0A223KNW7_9BACI|nr:hypothetical protein [Sutcliffiella cohnii]AST91096.1 hypothetical protein BC6307_07290 [Sutcliffiella cohnii]